MSGGNPLEDFSDDLGKTFGSDGSVLVAYAISGPIGMQYQAQREAMKKAKKKSEEQKIKERAKLINSIQKSQEGPRVITGAERAFNDELIDAFSVSRPSQQSTKTGVQI